MRRTSASVFVIASLIAAGAANAQSFDCRSARHPDEQAICRDPYLSKLDNQLAATFARTLNQLSPLERKELAEDEEDWVVSRRQCGADASCIAEEYRTRIRELTGVMPPPGTLRPNLPAASTTPREPAEQPAKNAAPSVPPRQAGPEPMQEKPQPQVIAERPPPRIVEAPPAVTPGPPPFPIVQPPPPPVVVERPSPAPERPPQPLTVETERDTDVVKRTSRPHHKPKQNPPAAASVAAAATAAPPATASNPPRIATSAPAPSGSPAKPSIQWVDPPPSR